jgi:hypothetical protein
MTIVDRITSMGEHLKESYQELEGIGIDTTGVNNNLENIPKLIDGYWETLPKVTGEGTSITLDNTKEGKMKIVLKGNTSQEGTPTPESPQDIHVVSGDNSIVVCGKNLLDSSTFLAGSYQGIDTTTRLHTGQALLLESNTYTLSTNLDMSTYKFYIVTGSTQVPFQTAKYNSGWVTNQHYSFTLSDSNKGYFCLCIGNVNGGTLTVDDIKDYHFQLEYGNNKTDFVPYQTPTSYPITLPEGMFLGWIPNTTYQDKIDKSSGKNLFDNNLFDTFTPAIKVITLNLKPNTNYTLSSNIPADYDRTIANLFIITSSGNPTTANNGVMPNSPRTMTTLNDGVIRIGYRDNSGNLSDEATKYWYMLNEGTTALEYEPYGTGWYLKKEIGKVVLDGSENWSTNASWNYTNTNIYMLNGNPQTTNEVVCDYFKWYRATYSNDINGEVGLVWGSTLSFRILNTIASDTEAFKTWLSTHNTIVYYVLNTPTYTEITDSTLLSQLNALAKSYTGQTNISQESNDMPFILDITALKGEE